VKGYKKYFRKRIIWYLITLVIAVILNFMLPRLMPGDPVAAITANSAAGLTDRTAAQQIYDEYAAAFGLDKPLYQQFFIWLGKLFQGDMGISFINYPRPVSDMIGSAVWWTIGLQLPAILTGWIIGNLLGALAAYKGKWIDKGVMPASMFISGFPAFGLATILIFVFVVKLKIAPAGGGYSFDLLPSFSWEFIKSFFVHYQLPFWSIVLTTIGGQAIGMRSMSIYELNADYVKYSRFLGVEDRKIVGYVFHNAMLPQVTGLALSMGTMIGGALVAEIVFSYPGLGYTLVRAVTGQDYPVISGCTLIITIMVLLANLALEIIYGFIDPRVKAAQVE
jgi:peptide/nickel transport system permease protein